MFECDLMERQFHKLLLTISFSAYSEGYGVERKDDARIYSEKAEKKSVNQPHFFLPPPW